MMSGTLETWTEFLSVSYVCALRIIKMIKGETLRVVTPWSTPKFRRTQLKR